MGSKGPTRRSFVRQIMATGAALPFASLAFSQVNGAPASSTKNGPNSLSPADDNLLDDLEKANFQYFWDQTNPKTGLVRDRCNVQTGDGGTVGSIAATGFGLTALCIGEKRGFILRSPAQERVQ